MLDDEGGVVAESRHLPYGGVRWSAGTLTTEYRFAGQMLEERVNLYHMGARWYDDVGRWTSPDSIVPDPRNPQSLNRFSHVRGNPLKYNDPSGNQENEIVEDRLRKDGKFCDSIIFLLLELAGSETGLALVEFLLSESAVDVTIEWASSAVYKESEQFTESDGGITGAITMNGRGIYINSNRLLKCFSGSIEQRGDVIVWHPTENQVRQLTLTLGHELFHVLQGPSTARNGAASEANAYLVEHKIRCELYGKSLTDRKFGAKYEVDENLSLRSMSSQDFHPRDVALWRAMLVYPVELPKRGR